MYYIVNNPTDQTIQDAHLFVESIDPSGSTALEQVVTQALPPGPTVIPVENSLLELPDGANPDLMAIWSDGGGNILDSTARLEHNFQVDPLPAARATATGWDLGTVYQGQPLYREFAYANVGQGFLPVKAVPDGFSAQLKDQRQANLLPLQAGTTGLLADTGTPGAISGDLLIRTGDIHQPEIRVPVSGTVLATPNLAIADSDITFSNLNPASFSTVTVTAAVHNAGPDPVNGVEVHFISQDPLSGESQVTSQTINVPAGGQSNASMSFTYISYAQNVLSVQVNPDQAIPETDWGDNSAFGYLNVSTTLPADGVLTARSVVRITDPAQFVTTDITISNQSTLLVEGITASLNSLMVSGSGRLVLHNSNLTITNITSDADSAASDVVLTGNSTLQSSAPISINSQRVFVYESTINSTGNYPGNPGSITITAAQGYAQDAALTAQGGLGANAPAASSSAGNGGNGGSATLSITTGESLTLFNTPLQALSGNGGNGGRSYDAIGGNGGTGGTSNILLVSPLGQFDLSSVISQAGTGGAGGVGDTYGGNGGTGGAASLSVQINVLNNASSPISSYGGNGGNHGGFSERAGGNGGHGGSASAEITGNSVILNDCPVTVTSGSGMGGGNSRGTYNARDGGNGAAAQLAVQIEELRAYPLDLMVTGGNGAGGGNSGDVSGLGGSGGSGQASINGQSFIASIARLAITGGTGGAGGTITTHAESDTVAQAGGNGGNASLTSGLTSVHTSSLDLQIRAGNGGDGGDNYIDAGEHNGGNGGNGGSVTNDWQVAEAFEPGLSTMQITRGIGGAAGEGTPTPAAHPGTDGARTLDLSVGYSGPVLPKRQVKVDALAPNYLDIAALVSVSAEWDGGASRALFAPHYPTQAPDGIGYHQLNLTYTYTDGTTATSHHRLLVYNATSDFDSDGLKDTEEVNITRTSPVRADSDGDGLTDGAEIDAHSKPLQADSDYDLTLDGADPDVLNRPDVLPQPGSLLFSKAAPTDGEMVALSVTVANPGDHDARGIVVGFFNGGTYLCGSFIESLAIAASSVVSCDWDTSGLAGQQTIYAVVDAPDRMAEENENNNIISASLTILTRPDLQIETLTPSPIEAQDGQVVTFGALLRNTGQTAANGFQTALYAGSPPEGAALASVTASLAANTEQTLNLPWTAIGLGTHTFTTLADATGAINEIDETNNTASGEVYVGLGQPVYIDAGGPGDGAYSEETGYGYLTPGSAITSCGSQPAQTYRQRNSGEQLLYRIDHLLASHFYHLDLTFSLCSGSRNLRVLVDGIELANPVVASSTPNSISLLLDPALYADHSITITIEKVGGGLGGPVVSELKLTDIRYCYRDSGHPDEQVYEGAPDGCGWLNGYPDQSWGVLPYQSVRYNDQDTVAYRFDRLQAGGRYRVNLTFYAGDSPGSRTQSVLVDGQQAASGIIPAAVPQQIFVTVPPAAYATDGSIRVEISDASQPVISEIALEEITLSDSGIPVNAEPVANDDAFTFYDNADLTVGSPGILTNDTDADGDPLATQLVSAPLYGQLTLNPDGSFTYQPGEGWHPEDSFTYRAYDGQSYSNTATVQIRRRTKTFLPGILK